ncbi:outer membrane scaffolding protein for murein synthesis (MipA/OmpV family) [Hephaestia caeni]|uniref:Outer membrane scaffolding protein for murein synthesis (MipA/OmpV family) n=1 Tax=Hephaestia caeni TaxID=645617 RepID=A0A397PBL5_9SPHN|nr:MipA/OmpV family protein [Hephaestia caeni]RIA44605.1 outer membrane scaffolding protein for murein synthesis (MipA/OmpV family) [Hephaestia caeni]
MIRHLLFVPAVSAAAALAPQSAAGQDADAPAPDDNVTVGLGLAYLPDYEGSDDHRVAIGPGAIGSVGGFAFTLAGNRASLDLIRNASGPGWDVQAGPIAVVNFDRSSIKNIDDARIKALGKVDTAIELGGYVGIGKTGVITSPYDKLSVSLSYRHDVSGGHDSAILQPTINYFTPLSRKAAIGLFASAEHAGKGYARTYFGITPGQSAASGLPVYTASSGWKNYTIGTIATYALTGDLLHGVKLVAAGTYKRMLGDFGDSPVVSIAGDRDQWMGAVGLAYTF